jgi:SAM-dependent methyltransferase
MLAEFRFERVTRSGFTIALAADTAAMVGDLWRGCRRTAPRARPCSTGGGAGYFASAFTDAGWHYIGVEPDPRRCTPRSGCGAGTGDFVRASGLALPFRDHSVDVCLSSNVAEHVAQPWQLGAEMLRVTRPGGLVILSYTVWLGPFGGHEMGLTHYLGGARGRATPAGTAIRRRTTSGRHFSRSQRPTGCRGRRALARWSPHFPATTRDGRGG